MRKFVAILCLLLNLGIGLMPFNTTHAHVGNGDHHDTVHAGHSHDFDGGHSHDDADHDAGQVVDLKPALTSQSNAPATFWAYSLPLICVIAVLSAAAQICISLLRPPSSDRKPGLQNGYWRPPLRGPPAASIQAV